MFLLPSIRAKIGVYAGLLLALSMTAGIGYAVKMARDSALENAVQVVRDSAVIEASRIQRHFELGMDAARNTAATFEVLRSSSREPSREDVVGILKQLVLGNSDFFGSWCVWEPDAFDGKDAAYANAPGHTRTGRFVPYWNKVGGLHLEGTGDTLEQPGEDTWYTQPRDSGAETVLEPAVYEVNGKDTMMVSLAVPIRDGNKSVGVVGADLSAEFLQSIADGMDEFDGKATMTLFCHTGKVAAVTGRRDVAGKPLSGIAANSKEMLQAVQQKREYKDFSDGALHMVVPLTFGNSPQVWGIAISVPESIIYAHAREMAWSLSFIGLFGLVVALGVLVFLATVISRPIRDTAAAIDSISEGNLDVRLVPRGRDEVAVMQNAVNVMAVKLKDNIAEIEAQNKLAQEKTLQAEQATLAAEESRKQAEQARSQGMLQAAQKLEFIVERMSGASGEISRQAAEVLAGSEHQKDRITQAATAMEEMNATVLEVARSAGQTSEQAQRDKENALEGAQVVNRTVTAMTKVQQQAETLKAKMNDLGVQAESIGHIMTVIEDIADQTNLLALNAAIEAARAGDAGRGFAVVADEVRKLAEKTMNATKEVGQSIRTIQGGTQSNIQSMDVVVRDIEEVAGLSKHSGEVLEGIVAGAEESAGRIQSIAAAAEEQSATSEEINRSVEEINVIAGQTSAAIAETAQSSDELARQAAELQQLIAELKAEAR